MLKLGLRSIVTALAVVCPLLAMTNPALAQWSSNAAVNLAVANRTGIQDQAKIRPTSDGGCYISWYDNSAGGYDVYIQRLDRNGNEQFAHNGVLVADRSFSSTQDYGLAVDANDNAIITYRDDRSTGVQIGVNKILPDGTLAWGTNGVLVTNTTSFVASPKVAVTSGFEFRAAASRRQRIAAMAGRRNHCYTQRLGALFHERHANFAQRFVYRPLCRGDRLYVAQASARPAI